MDPSTVDGWFVEVWMVGGGMDGWTRVGWLD